MAKGRLKRVLVGKPPAMNPVNAVQKIRSLVVWNLVFAWIWRHREEARVWVKSLPLLLRRARKKTGSVTLPEVRALTNTARSLDHERWAMQTSRVGLRDQLKRASKRGPRVDSEEPKAHSMEPTTDESPTTEES